MIYHAEYERQKQSALVMKNYYRRKAGYNDEIIEIFKFFNSLSLDDPRYEFARKSVFNNICSFTRNYKIDRDTFMYFKVTVNEKENKVTITLSNKNDYTYKKHVLDKIIHRNDEIVWC